MSKLVIIRHGVTEWSDRFTGWTDIDIQDEGKKETHRYGLLLKQLGYSFDVAFTSYLKRAIRTLWIVLDAMDMMWLPTIKSWKLNERHYGALQGLNKAETVQKYGEKQVTLWRRSYDIPPPLLEKNDQRNPKNDPRYFQIDPQLLPLGESLKNTYERTVPYWNQEIKPLLMQKKNIVLSAHHNSLRSIIKHIDTVSNEDIMHLNIPYCIPLVYEFDKDAKPIKHYYLAPDKEVERVIESIKNQTKTK